MNEDKDLKILNLEEEKDDTIYGIVGLNNFGNTCFLNTGNFS